MKKIDSLILKSFIPPFITTFCIATFVLIMQFLWKYIDDLVGKGLEWYVVAELMFYVSASIVPLAMPIACLLSAIMTFGNLGEHHELVALKAAGISLRRFMMPIAAAAVLISGASFLFSNYWLPVANLKFAALLYSVTQQKPALNIRPGVFYNGIEGFVIKIGKKDEESKIIEDIYIYDHTRSRANAATLMLAQKGEMTATPDGQFLLFTLFNGVQYEEASLTNSPQKTPFVRTYFDEYEMRISLANFDFQKMDESMFKNNQRMLNTKQLTHLADSLYQLQQNLNIYSQQNVRPYYNILKDTIDIKNIDNKKNTAAAPNTITDTTFIAQLPPQVTLMNRAQIAQRALAMANGIKSYTEIAVKQRETNIKTYNKYMIEYHGKITLSVACLLLFLIGAPLGSIIRKGGMGLPMIVAILLFIAYHLLSTFGRKFAEEEVMQVPVGMWLSTFVFLPIAFLLMYAAQNDLTLFNKHHFDFITNFFKRLLIQKK